MSAAATNRLGVAGTLLLQSNAWAAISARETLALLGILGVVCSIPCHLPYGLRHHVIFLHPASGNFFLRLHGHV
jgi:hypothetical protein